jgi:hypothetical protein
MIFEKKICIAKNDSQYLYICYKKIQIRIYEDQRYLIEYILDQANKQNDFNRIYLYDFKDLYDKCDRNNFFIYCFAYQNKDFVKSEMFSKWKRLGLVLQNKRNII